MPRIVISIADQVFNKTASTGIYNFSTGLVAALAAKSPGQLHILANSTQAELPDGIPADRMDRPARSLAGRLFWDQLGVYRQARKTGCEWLLLPKGFASSVRPCPLKLAVYIHDMIPLLCAKRDPGSVSRRKVFYLTQSYRSTLRQAAVVFTNTEHTRQDIERWALEQKIVCPPVHVAGYGFISPARAAVRKNEQILVLIRPDRHKLPDLCLEYMTRWCRESGWEGKVVCAGCTAQDVGAESPSSWHWLGRISATRCVEEMQKSQAVVHFSSCEGFGMPPVEAVLAGTCPVYSAIPVAVEVMQGCGGGFKNDRYESFSSAMAAALGTSGEKLMEWREALLQRHNWSRVTEKILSVLN